MRSKILAVITLLALSASAQEGTRSVHLLGVGNTNILDTYLSQEKYKGDGFTYLYIREGATPEKRWNNVIEHELDWTTEAGLPVSADTASWHRPAPTMPTR